MQPQSQLNLQLKPGSPASAVPRKWFMFINNVLRFLTVQNGTLIANNDKWTLVCGGAGVWSGYWWFGGVQEGPIDESDIEGKYFGCDLRNGVTQFADEPTDTDNIEWRYVADKDEDTGEYTPSNRTCGDIVFRIV
jgi:hypothetical protein